MRYVVRVLDAVDVYVLLGVASRPAGEPWSQVGLAQAIGVSPSVASRALRKAEEVGLYSPARKRVSGPPLVEALIHGARFFLAPRRGGESRGVPTAWAAPPLLREIVSGDILPPVWPDPAGEARGLSLQPLHPSAPQAARRDPAFYAMLALVDALRTGDARVRALAGTELRQRMGMGEGFT